jgi:hypothetical protein
MDYVIIPGRAEISRLILAYAGVRYTDERLGQFKYLFPSFLSALLKNIREHTVAKNHQLIYIFFRGTIGLLYILDKQKVTFCIELNIFCYCILFLLKNTYASHVII